MKRLLLILAISLAFAIPAHSQVTSQNARRLFSGTGAPTLNCNPGNPWTDTYINKSDHSLWVCEAAPNTWRKVVSGGTPGNVVGPASAVSGHLATFTDNTGKVIGDGGAIPTGVTNSAPADMIPKSDGINLISSADQGVANIGDPASDTFIQLKTTDHEVNIGLGGSRFLVGDYLGAGNHTLLMVDDTPSTTATVAQNLKSSGFVSSNHAATYSVGSVPSEVAPNPTTPVVSQGGGTNLLSNGNYKWKVVYTLQSDEKLVSAESNTIANDGTTGEPPVLTLVPPTSPFLSPNTQLFVYRTEAGGSVFKLAGQDTVTATSFVDNIADGDLGIPLNTGNGTKFELSDSNQTIKATAGVQVELASPDVTLSNAGYHSLAALATDVNGKIVVAAYGTGIATALATNVGTAGAPVVNGGALGSPSSAGTLPTFTLGGTVSGGGNQINNVVIGTTTPLAGSFTTLSSSSAQTGKVISVTTGATYSVLSTDYFVCVNKGTGSATGVTLPAGVTGRILIIKDCKGDAATNNITVTPAAGNIDGAGTFVMNANRQSITIIYNGTEWSIY